MKRDASCSMGSMIEQPAQLRRSGPFEILLQVGLYRRFQCFRRYQEGQVADIGSDQHLPGKPDQLIVLGADRVIGPATEDQYGDPDRFGKGAEVLEILGINSITRYISRSWRKHYTGSRKVGVLSLMDELKALINANPNVHINDLNF